MHKCCHPHLQMTKIDVHNCNFSPKFIWAATGKSWIWRDQCDIKTWGVNKWVILPPRWLQTGKESLTPDDSSHNKPVTSPPHQRQGQTHPHPECIFLPDSESEKEPENLYKTFLEAKKDALHWLPTLLGPINIL